MNITKFSTHKNAGLLSPIKELKNTTLIQHNQRPHLAQMVKTIDNVIVTTNCSISDMQLFCTALHNYTAAPLRCTTITNHSLRALEFEKKICRAGFKKDFGQHLPSPGSLEMNYGLLDVSPVVDSTRWKKKNKRLQGKEIGDGDFTNDPVKILRIHDFLNTDLCFRMYDPETGYRSSHDKRFLHSGIQLMSSDWVLERLVHQIRNKRSVRVVLNELIRDVEALFNNLLSACPVLGVRLTASGRLGKKKKGMSQQQTLSIGKVPLGTFSRKVDYSQGFVVTKFGLVGLKVWVAFR